MMNPKIQFFQKGSIRRKQRVIILVTCSVTLLLACAAFIGYDAVTFRRETVASLSSPDMFRDRLWHYAGIVSAVFAASLLVAFWLSSRLERVVSGPILHLAKVARSVALERDLSVRVTKQSSDELGELMDGFNEMLTRIQQRDAALQESRVELEKRAAERTRELANSLALTRATLESTTDGILVADERGKVTSFNENFLTMWRMPPELKETKDEQQLIEAAVSQLKDPEQYIAGIEDLYACPEKESFDVLEFNDGRTFERYSKPQRVGEEIAGRVWSFRDVTERRRAEAELAYERDLLRALLENASDLIYFKDAQSRFIRCSKSFCERSGTTQQEAIGKTDFDFYQHDHARPAFEDEQEIIRTGKPLIGKLEKESHPDGRVTWVLTTKMPFRDPTGRIVGTFGISKDITAVKQAEAELAFERHLLQTLMDHAPDVIYFKDRQSRFVRFSNAFAKLFLLADAASLKGKTDFDFFLEEHARPAFEDEQEIIRTGKPLIGKLEKESHPDGRTTWALTNKMPWRDAEGNIIGTFGISKDITEMKQAEEELGQLHKQLLETSRQAGMAEVATSVLHNVGNVLNSINVSTTLILESVKKSKIDNVTKVAALLDEHAADLAAFMSADSRGKQVPAYLGRLAKYLEDEQKALLKETELVRQNVEHIRDIVAMQQSYGRVSGMVEQVKVADLVEDALRMDAGAVTRRDVQIAREYNPNVPQINADKHKVLQILVNLIRNAKHACDEAECKEKRITVRLTNSDGLVRIVVADNGVGIPKENLTRIFNHGFTTRKEGHGFGLHSAANAAREMGGSLVAHSDGPRLGASFILELPLRPPKISMK